VAPAAAAAVPTAPPPETGSGSDPAAGTIEIIETAEVRLEHEREGGRPSRE
jgi:hypothetical protein